MRRRVLRRMAEDDAPYHQLPYATPYLVRVKEKASPLAEVFYFFGGLALFVAFMVQLILWLSSWMALPITLPESLVTWTPLIFAAGILLSLISIFVKPTSGKIILAMMLIAGYIALALGWIPPLA